MEPESYPETLDDFLQWAATPRDRAVIERVFDPPSPIARSGAASQSTLFSIIISKILDISGIDPNNQSTVTRIASQLPNWQTKPREFPFDAMLVEDWLQGKQFISKAGLNGLCRGLSGKAGLNKEQVKALKTLRDHIEQNLTENDNRPHVCDELNQTFAARLDRSDITARRLAASWGVSNVNASNIKYGRKPLSYEKAKIIDEQHESLSKDDGQIPLTDLYWHLKHEQAVERWKVSRSFGARLVVLMDFLDITTEELGSRLGVTNATISHWRTEANQVGNRHKHRPNKDQCEKLIEVLKELEDEKFEQHRESFTPILSHDRGQALMDAASKLTGNRRANLRSRQIDRAVIAEIVVMKDDLGRSFKNIFESGGYEDTFTAAHQIRYQYNKHKETGKPITDDERTEAKKRLGFEGAKHKTISCSVGAITRCSEIATSSKSR